MLLQTYDGEAYSLKWDGLFVLGHSECMACSKYLCIQAFHAFCQDEASRATAIQGLETMEVARQILCAATFAPCDSEGATDVG